jgi:pyruvate dehydrogenase E1 component alpha subunit
MFGDGAVDEGAFHESLNLASLWKLPVVYYCENNQYSMGMAVTKAWAVASLEPRAAAHGVAFEHVDGMDVLAVRETMLRAAERARNGEGPTLVESATYRFRGHSMTDPAYYRTRDEETRWRSTRDPIALFEEKLKEHGLITDEEINATNERVDAEVEEIARFAEESPAPEADELFDDVLADGTGAIAWRNKPSTPRD